MRKHIFLFTFFVLATLVAFAQSGTVRGFVYDKTTGEPIIFTNVVLKDTVSKTIKGADGTYSIANYGASTDVNGYFVISKVPKGHYVLRVSYMGYEELLKSITVTSGGVVALKLELSPSAKTLSSVEITDRKIDFRKERQVSIEKITSQEITQMPSIGGTSDLAQYMQVLPGVIFTGDQGGQLYIRGGSAIQNKVLLDGMVIYNPFHSIGLFSVFETDIIRNADIYTGGFGAKYGGILSSVMDITTREGNKKQTKGKIGASTFGANLLLEGPIIKEDSNRKYSLSYLLTAKNSYLSKTSKSIYSYIDGSLPYDFLDVYGKATLATENGTKLNVFGFNFADKVNNYKSIADYNWDNKGIGANFIIVPGNSSALVEGLFAYSDYKITMKNTTTQEQETSEIGGFNVSLSATNFIGKNQIKYGMEMLGSQTDESTLSNTIYSTELGLYGIFKGVWGPLTYEPSLRYTNYSSLGQGSLEPRLAMQLKITDWWHLKLATGLYSQIFIDTKPDRDIVNLYTGYMTIDPENINISPTFQGKEVSSYMQKAKHIIFGTEFDLWGNTSINIEGYYKKMDNLIAMNRNVLSDADYKYIIENGKAYGMDISFRYDNDRLYFWAVYSLGKVTRQDDVAEYAPHYDRRHNINVVLSYKMGLSRSWEVSLRWNYGSGFPFTPTKGGAENLNFQSGLDYDYTSTNGTLQMVYGTYNSKRLPAYHRLDASIKKSFDLSKNVNLELNFSVTNVYNRENLFYQDRVTGERVNQLPIMPSFGVTLSF